MAILAVCLLPGVAGAQRPSSYTEDRLNQMERTVKDLQGQIEQQKQRSQQLQTQMERLQSSYDSRLQRLEHGPGKGPPAKPVPKSQGGSHR
jgi:TolA-binding protein